jgi:lipopolysaccharide biosynthesis regulator YciM
VSNPLLIILILCLLVILFQFVTALVRSRRGRGAGKSPYMQGMAALLDGDRNAALGHFRQAVNDEPHEVDPYLRLGDVFREMGETRRAIQMHRELTVRPSMPKGTTARVLLSLARDYVKAKRLDRGAASYQQVLKIQPHNQVAMNELHDVYEELGEWDKAYLIRRDLSKESKVDDTRFLALYKAYIGKRYLDQGDLKKAESVLKDALKIDSECASAYLFLGDVYYANGGIDNAISSWRRIVNLFPEIAYITFRRLEKAFYEKGKYEKIVDLYNDILERNPKDVRTLMTLATIQRKKGNLDDALRLVQTALEFEPESRRIKQALAKLYYEKGETEQSLKAMVEAFNGFASDDEQYDCSSCCYRSNEVLWRCPKCGEWETFI